VRQGTSLSIDLDAERQRQAQGRLLDPGRPGKRPEHSKRLKHLKDNTCIQAVTLKNPD